MYRKYHMSPAWMIGRDRINSHGFSPLLETHCEFGAIQNYTNDASIIYVYTSNSIFVRFDLVMVPWKQILDQVCLLN